MSDYRFGDDYRLNYDHRGDKPDDDCVDWDAVQWVEIDGTMFVRGRTCRIKHRVEAVSPGGMEGDEWYYCDSCGYELDDDEHVAWGDYVTAVGPAPFRRCPNCGAKVVG